MLGKLETIENLVSQVEARSPETVKAYRERQFDVLARTVRESLDMDAVYRILRGE